MISKILISAILSSISINVFAGYEVHCEGGFNVIGGTTADVNSTFNLEYDEKKVLLKTESGAIYSVQMVMDNEFKDGKYVYFPVLALRQDSPFHITTETKFIPDGDGITLYVRKEKEQVKLVCGPAVNKTRNIK
ncbi:MAG: hypothetical protein ACXVCY_16580 [Pseudobdellovibrionaceae bacterium]